MHIVGLGADPKGTLALYPFPNGTVFFGKGLVGTLFATLRLLIRKASLNLTTFSSAQF